MAPGGCRQGWLALKRIVSQLSLLPVLAVVCLLFWGGLALALIRALGVYPAYGMLTPTLAYGRAVLADQAFLPSLALTVRVASGSTLLASGLGTALALAAALTLRPSWRLRLLLQMPLYFPHLIVANIILLLFAPSGLFARFLHCMHLAPDIADVPVLVYDRWGYGMILGLAYKEIPFVAVLVYPFAAAALGTYAPAARTLGARPWSLVRYVALPMAWPALATAAVIVFAYGFSSFDVPYLLGRTYPKVLATWAYELYTNADPVSRPLALAIGMVIVLVNLLLATFYALASRRYAALLDAIRSGKTT